MVAVTPLVGVYIFSVQFINRGIDNWFSVDVEQGFDDALALVQTVLETQKRARLEQVQDLARRLGSVPRAELPTTLNALRRDTDAVDLTVYGPNNQILAITSIDPEPGAPHYPTDEVLFQLRQQRPVRQRPAAEEWPNTRSSRRPRSRRPRHAASSSS